MAALTQGVNLWWEVKNEPGVTSRQIWNIEFLEKNIAFLIRLSEEGRGH
jgi:hypothetical protein